MYQSEYIEVKQLSGEPIIQVTVKHIENFAAALNEIAQASFDILDKSQEPAFWILDPGKFQLSLDNLVAASNFVTRSENPLWRHPMIRQIVVVSPRQMLRLAARGMKTDIFGNVSIEVFDTVDESLSYARARLATG